MKNRYLLNCGVLVLANLALTLDLYSQLPARIPTHWNGRGEIDAYGPRASVFVHTGFMVLFMLIWTVLPSVSPKRFTVDTFNTSYWQICVIFVALFGYIQCTLVFGAYSPAMPMNRTLFGGLAIFVGLPGNVMGKVRRNFWIGIRTPWTPDSERAWYASHRFAAGTMVAGALLACWPACRFPTPLALVVAGLIVPVFYSLMVYKRLEKSGELEA